MQHWLKLLASGIIEIEIPATEELECMSTQNLVGWYFNLDDAVNGMRKYKFSRTQTLALKRELELIVYIQKLIKNELEYRGELDEIY